MRSAAVLGLVITAVEGTVVTLEHECGDLASCAFLDDGECDDGGPAVYASWKEWSRLTHSQPPYWVAGALKRT